MNIDECIIYLINKKPFYAHLVIGMRKEFTNRIPTAGVSITDKVNLIINPDFFRTLNPIEQAAVLEHECLHVVMNHFKRREHRKHRMYNVAADMAINDYIKGLPKEIRLMKDGKPVTDKEGKEVKSKLIFAKDMQLPQFQTSEYYYEQLQKRQDQNKDQQYEPGQDTLDDHDVWGESIDNDEVIDEKIKGLVKPAMDAARKAGQFPHDLEKLVSALFNKAKDWRQDLQKFAAKNTEILGESSRKVRNRRYGILFPGYKKMPHLTLAVAVDTSGSVPDEALDQFMAEIAKIEKQGATIWIIESDADVHACYKFDPRKKIKFHGRGGTSFGPALRKAEELDVDGVIYMTDGDDYGPETKKPSFPVMWALLKGCQIRYKWGYKTFIEVRKAK